MLLSEPIALFYIYLKTMTNLSYFANLSNLRDIFKEYKTISYYSQHYAGALIITAFCYHKMFPGIDKAKDH